MPSIRPSSDLGSSYDEISTFCNDNREPVFITKNGHGDLAVMSIEAYEQLSGENELISLLNKGIADIKAGRTHPIEDVFDEIEQAVLNGKI